MTERKHVTIYTDGACHGNPGPGGYGVVLLYGERRREVSGGHGLTTNNRMELMGPIEALKTLKERCQVTLYSDSKYVVDSMAKGWHANGWMRNKREKAINTDLWAQLLDLCQSHQVEFRWTKGHAGNPENERCDFLATEAANGTNLPVDSGYHHPNM